MALVRKRRSGTYELELRQVDDLGGESAIGTAKALGADGYTIRFLKELDVFNQSDYVVVAKVGMRVVGVFGLMHVGLTQRGGWETRGTYTISPYRRQGVATAMWNFAVRSLGIRHLDCVVITRSGREFARAWKKTRIAKLELIDDTG